MPRVTLLAALVSSLAIGGCGYKYGLQPDPASKYNVQYKEPERSEQAANIIGSVLEARPPMVNEAIRARVEAIDDLVVPSTSTRTPGPVRVAAGNHKFLVVCEDEAGDNETYAEFSAEIIASHSYIARCKEKTVWLNIGMRFWLEDQSDGGKIMLTTEAWGPNHRGGGSTF